MAERVVPMNQLDLLSSGGDLSSIYVIGYQTDADGSLHPVRISLQQLADLIGK